MYSTTRASRLRPNDLRRSGRRPTAAQEPHAETDGEEGDEEDNEGNEMVPESLQELMSEEKESQATRKVIVKTKLAKQCAAAPLAAPAHARMMRHRRPRL